MTPQQGTSRRKNFTNSCSPSNRAEPVRRAVAAAILTIAVCLVIHAFVLFGVLRWQSRFRRLFPEARGAWLVVPSILLATVMLVASHRILEPVEATNGMLAAGLNTALLFAILSNMAKKDADYDDFFH